CVCAHYFALRIPPDRSNFSTNCFDRCCSKSSRNICAKSLRRRGATFAETWRRNPPGPSGRKDRQRRGHLRGPAHSKQNGHLDGRCRTVAGWKMVGGGDRSRRSRAHPTRSSSSKSSGDFRGRRYGLARSGRKTAGGRRSSCNATRTLCWKIDSAPAYRQEAAQAFSLLRQRHHGRRWQGVRSSAERQTSAARSHCVAGLGFHSHHVSVSAQSENQRVLAMGLVVPNRTARFAVDRELSRIGTGTNNAAPYSYAKSGSPARATRNHFD